jgi:hypothetical protein
MSDSILKTIRIKEKTSPLAILLMVLSYIVITLATTGPGKEGGSFFIMFLIIVVSSVLYFINPTISFIFTLVPIIEPTGSLKFVSVQFLFLILCFASVFLNFQKYLRLIKTDKYLKRMLLMAFFFMIYQFNAFRDTGGSGTISYILSNVRQIFGIWLILPAYYFVITDRKDFFISILILSIITYFYYYISYLKIYQIIQIVEANRGMESDIVRAKTRDFCYIIKIIGYFLPILLLVRFKPKSIRLSMLFLSLMAYGVLFTALLRLDTVYTFLGGLLGLFFLISKYKIKVKVSNLLGIAFFLSILFIVFNEQFANVIETFTGTYKAVGGNAKDSSMTFRTDFELPILLTYIVSNPLFGIGNYSVIMESFNKYDFWANDMALLSAIGIYGIVGILLYLTRFIVLYWSMKSAKIPRITFEKYKLEVIIYYALVAFFIAQLFFKFYLTFAELLSNETYAEFGVLFGVFYGLRRFLEIKTLELNEG